MAPFSCSANYAARTIFFSFFKLGSIAIASGHPSIQNIFDFVILPNNEYNSYLLSHHMLGLADRILRYIYSFSKYLFSSFDVLKTAPSALCYHPRYMKTLS